MSVWSDTFTIPELAAGVDRALDALESAATEYVEACHEAIRKGYAERHGRGQSDPTLAAAAEHVRNALAARVALARVLAINPTNNAGYRVAAQHQPRKEK